jgi:nucleotide-binding universal stress UspA family protein
MTERIQIERILCPTDFSEFSVRALRHATALARRFGARLTVLHVIPQWVPYTHAPAYFPGPMLANPALCRHVEQDVREFAAPAIEAGVPVETMLREAEPWREIQAVAEELPADLVVMGTHGRGGFEQLLLGAVAEKVLRRAPCPVLTVCHEEGRTWEAPGLIRRILCATDLSEASGPTIRYALSLAEEYEAAVTPASCGRSSRWLVSSCAPRSRRTRATGATSASGSSPDARIKRCSGSRSRRAPTSSSWVRDSTGCSHGRSWARHRTALSGRRAAPS